MGKQGKYERKFFRWTTWVGSNTMEGISIGHYSPNGTTNGEFRIEWVRMSNFAKAARLVVFDDAWKALLEFKDVLEKLAELIGTIPSPEEICEILLACGVKDMTSSE